MPYLLGVNLRPGWKHPYSYLNIHLNPSYSWKTISSRSIIPNPIAYILQNCCLTNLLWTVGNFYWTYYYRNWTNVWCCIAKHFVFSFYEKIFHCHVLKFTHTTFKDNKWATRNAFFTILIQNTELLFLKNVHFKKRIPTA